MKRVLLILIIFLSFSNCSLDTKTGIWTNEENIEKIYPTNFPVKIEKIGTNYLPLVLKSFELFCHPYINWIENYKYFLIVFVEVQLRFFEYI